MTFMCEEEEKKKSLYFVMYFFEADRRKKEERSGLFLLDRKIASANEVPWTVLEARRKKKDYVIMYS